MDNLPFGTEVLVHLDLKGAPPRVTYLEKLLPFIRDLGATGVLIEWEDTFPYTGELIQLGGRSEISQAIGAPYSIEEAKRILDAAAACGLKVIPLVQTFGHLEFVLKHERWRELREVEGFPSSMCPLRSGTMNLVKNLVQQIVVFHSGLQYIHIGADEVWHLGVCEECAPRARRSRYDRAVLYLEHVTAVAQYIRDTFPNLRIIIWDDMLRSMDVAALHEYRLGELVEPMIWHYGGANAVRLGAPLWDKYGEVFNDLWVATAFKGAASGSQILPPHRHYVENHAVWLTELGLHAGKVRNIKGVALTGWSRFDHYATLCELLPVAVPSLALCLRTWRTGGYSSEVHAAVAQQLGYGAQPLPYEERARPCPMPPHLLFPGSQVLIAVEWFANVRAKYKSIVDSDQVRTWFNEWQISNNYTNPMQLESILSTLTNLVTEISAVESYLKEQLDMCYYPPSVGEFLGTLVVPAKQHLRQLKNDCEKQIAAGCRPRGTKYLNV